MREILLIHAVISEFSKTVPIHLHLKEMKHYVSQNECKCKGTASKNAEFLP